MNGVIVNRYTKHRRVVEITALECIDDGNIYYVNVSEWLGGKGWLNTFSFPGYVQTMNMIERSRLIQPANVLSVC